MEVRILGEPVISLADFQAYGNSIWKCNNGNISKRLPVLNKASISQCFATKMLISERPPVIRKQTWEDDKRGDNRIMNKCSVEIIRSYSHSNPLLDRKSNSKFFASNLLDGSPHFHEARKSTTDSSSDEICDVDRDLTAGLSIERNEGRNTALNMQTHPTSQRRVSSASDANTEVGRKDVNSMPNDPVKKSAKRKSKSGKKKRSKSSVKRKHSHRHQRSKGKGDLAMPIKKELSSCFSVYSSQLNHQVPSETLIDKTHVALNLRPADFLDLRIPVSKSSCGKRQQKGTASPQRRNSHCIRLPPTTSPPSKPLTQNSLKHEAFTAHRMGSPTLNETKQRNLQTIMPSQMSKRDSSIALPPHPALKLTQLNTLQTNNKVFDETEKKKLMVKAYRRGRVPKLDEGLLKENNLGDRLNLIHSYGNDYHLVTQKIERQRKKEISLEKQKEKESRREEIEKQKLEQRNKIYALNRLMADFEQKNFEIFMASLHAAKNLE